MFKIITSTQTFIQQGPHPGRSRTLWGRGTPFTSKPTELDKFHTKTGKEFGTVYAPQKPSIQALLHRTAHLRIL